MLLKLLLQLKLMLVSRLTHGPMILETLDEEYHEGKCIARQIEQKE